MPAPTSEFIATTPTSLLSFGLEPALNAFNSLSLLNKTEYLQGLDDWVTRTIAALPKERWHTHEVVFVGLYYAVEPQRSYADFTDYIDDVARQDPLALRDRVFDAYANCPWNKSKAAGMRAAPLPAIETATLLADRETFLNYLRERFSPDHVIERIEIEAHRLLNDPPAMKELIVSHLQYMWTEVMAAEWERARTLLQACVDAYRQIDFNGLSSVQATQQVVGHELDEHWQNTLSDAGRIVFVPSAHVGPYLMRFTAGTVTYLLFGARQPQGILGPSPDLSRSELLVRLMALADDTRLRILHLLAQRGEMCSPDIIRELELSQSAASRHLQQLSATGYIFERRRDGAKCYSLNGDHVDDTFRALSHFLEAQAVKSA
jgi:DNA-binding transcriptional ArsR family regulator